MKKLRPYLLALGLFLGLLPLTRSQVTLAIDAVPANTPLSDSLYVASNFNTWNPGDPAAQLARKSGGKYFLTLSGNLPNPLEYKFTRGNWATVEGNASGNARPNRTLVPGQADTVWHQILSWEDLGGGTTANAHVSVLTDSFYMPQLNRYRRIWLYLPGDYHSSAKHYPVLYMHDGQNLFDARTSFSGEWEVDETLAALEQNGDYGAIVVGIDNGGSHRTDEYCPYVNPGYGGGEGAAYGEFLVQTLKPYIDSSYRTLPGPLHTAIAGSSLGGLISMYLGLKYQEVFGKVGVFSPAFWINPGIYAFADSMGSRSSLRVYFLAGQQESVSMVPDMQNMYDQMKLAGFPSSDLAFEVRSDGQHSEWFWAREFGPGYQWLFAGAALDLLQELSGEVQVYPNPASGVLWVETHTSADLDLWDMQGRLIQHWQISTASGLDLTGISKGMYVMRIRSGGKQGWQKVWVY